MNTKIKFLSFLFVLAVCNLLVAQESYNTLVYEGNRKFENKNYDGASSKFMEAVKMKDKDFTSHYNLGNALYKSKKYDEAKTEFEKAQQFATNDKDRAAAQYNLGNTYMQANQPEKAAELYKKVLKQDPYNETARKNYEIAKLKDKANQQQQKDQQKDSGKGGGGDKNKGKQDGKGEQKDQKGGGNSQQNKGEGEDGNQPPQQKVNNNNSGNMPKELENSILNKVKEKEQETAKRILNKNSYSMPQSNEKDW